MTLSFDLVHRSPRQPRSAHPALTAQKGGGGEEEEVKTMTDSNSGRINRVNFNLELLTSTGFYTEIQQSVLFVLLPCPGLLPPFSLKTARHGEVSAAFHNRIVPSAEQDRRRWWAELWTTPHTESVWPESAPLRTEESAAQSIERNSVYIRTEIHWF